MNFVKKKEWLRDAMGLIIDPYHLRILIPFLSCIGSFFFNLFHFYFKF